MSLKFAKFWNKNYQTQAIVSVNGKPFGFAEARAVLRQACADPKGLSLKTAIDTGKARLIVGPHKSPADSRLHMTVHCKEINTTYHVYLSRTGGFSGIDREPVGGVKPKTGHVLDDPDQPTIDNSAAL